MKQYFDINGVEILIGSSVTHTKEKWIRFVTGFDNNQLVVWCVNGEEKVIGCQNLVVIRRVESEK